MALVDLKKTQDEVREDKEAISERRISPPDYPYGLRLTLDRETLSKLEFPIKQVKINDTVDLICKAEIIGIHSDIIPDQPEEQRVEIQITHLDFSLPEPEGKFKGFHDRQVAEPGGEVGE